MKHTATTEYLVQRDVGGTWVTMGEDLNPTDAKKRAEMYLARLPYASFRIVEVITTVEYYPFATYGRAPERGFQ